MEIGRGSDATSEKRTGTTATKCQLGRTIIEPLDDQIALQSAFESFWGSPAYPLMRSDLSSFTGQYMRACRHEVQYDVDCHWSHNMLIDVANQVRSGIPRENIMMSLESEAKAHGKTRSNNVNVNKLIDFAARLTSLVEIEDIRYTNKLQSNNYALRWQTGPLKALVRTHFEAQMLLEDKVKFEPLFNAMNLKRIGGIRVRWTSNLLEHLELFEDDSEVAIFHQASFLRLQWDLKAVNVSSILPTEVIEETLDTLSLLLPKSNKALTKWYEKQRARAKGQQELDPNAIKCNFLRRQDRRIEHFSIWRDRLVILKQAFDSAEPKGITQWWFDRRKRVQWYTFWIASLVLVLTLCQLIVGILQVEAAYHSHGSR